MPFCDVYVVKAGDNLTKIAKSKGYKTPAAIIGFPNNQTRFATPAKQNLIRPGERILIPWHPLLLKKLIATSEFLANQVAEDAKRMIEGQDADKEELDSFLKRIDAINFIASVNVEIGSLIAESAQHGAMSSEAMLMWLVDAKVSQVREITTLIVPEPSAPKRDFKFYIRHTLGPWTPSFWASVYAAVKTGDVDTYLYGADAVRYRRCQEISVQANRDIEKLKSRILAAKAQLGMPYYFGA